MARPRKPITLSVSSSQAVYVLERAVADGKLSAADVDRYIAQMHNEISSLEARIAHLRDAIVAPVRKLFGGGMPFPLGKHKIAGGKGRVSAALRSHSIGAGNRTRTGDIDLGKVALYQLSYARERRRRLVSVSGAVKRAPLSGPLTA